MKNPFKRLPPILYPLYIPYGLALLLYYFVTWLLGFWRCHNCNKTFWLTDGRYERLVCGEWKDTCEGCYTKLTSK
ncbi:hypothetical protein [Bacillus wiedmannii]|uniref:hypothetical protein n=1 Tax=Bacillus wiedmannii TaxID=1890302 RepID=UPI00114288E2|nr:hypothetical protein [Bacillus wiedmannii]